MPTAIEQLQSVAAKLQAYRPRFQTHVLPLHDIDYNFDWPQRYAMIENGDWAELKSESASQLFDLEQRVLALEAEQAEINAIFGDLAALKPGFLAKFKSEPPAATFEASIDEISNAAMLAEDKQALIDKLTEMSSSGLVTFNHLVSEVEKFANLLNDLTDVHLSKVAYNYFSLLTATLNLDESGAYEGDPDNLHAYYRDMIEEKFTTIKSKVEASDDDIPALLHDAIGYLRDKIETRFLPCLNHLLNSANTTYAQKRTLSKVSHLIMMGLTSYFGLRWMSWTYAWHPLATVRRTLESRIKSLDIDRIEMPGLDRSINVLLADALEYDGVEVCSEGTFGDLHIMTLGPDKAVSVGSLTHPDTQNKVGVLIPFFRLDSVGLFDGAFCDVSGVFHQAHSENDNQPTIVVDRLNLADLGKTNFLAWLRLKTRYIFEETPHNFSLRFSFGKGTSSMASPIKYDVVSVNRKPHNPNRFI